MDNLLPVVWSAAGLSAVAAVILSRSGFGAWPWIAVLSACAVGAGAALSVAGLVLVGRSFRAYAAQSLTLSRFDRRLNRHAALRFAGLQTLSVGVLLGIATSSALVFPGLPTQAVPVTVVLTASLWALHALLMTQSVTGVAVERLASGTAQRRLADLLPFWSRPPGGWRLAARVDLARRAADGNDAATAWLNALDSDGAVHPDLAQRGPSVAEDAVWRAVTVLPVMLAALPFAVAAWACAVLLPDAWVPRLPSPDALFGLDAPPDTADKPDPEPQSPLDDQPSDGSDSAASSGNSGSAAADSGGAQTAERGEGSADAGAGGAGDAGQGVGAGDGQTADGAGQGGEGSADSGAGSAGDAGAGDGQAADGAGEGGEGSADAGAGGAGDAGVGDGQTGDGAGADTATGAGGQPQSGDAQGQASADAATGPKGPGAGDDAPSGGDGTGPGDGAADAASAQPSQSGEGGASPGGEGATPGQPQGEVAQDGAGPPPGTGGTDASADPLAASAGGSTTEGDGGASAAPDVGAPDAEPGDVAPAGDRTGASATVSLGGSDAAGQGADSADVPQAAEITEGPPPPGARVVAVTPLDGPVPPDAEVTQLTATGTADAVPEGGDGLSIGSSQALFAEPGRAPDTVETRLDDDAALPPDLPPAPAAQQRLPAWIADLLNDQG